MLNRTRPQGGCHAARCAIKSLFTVAALHAAMASMIFAINCGRSPPPMYPGCFIRGLMSNPGQVKRFNSETTTALPGARSAARAICDGVLAVLALGRDRGDQIACLLHTHDDEVFPVAFGPALVLLFLEEIDVPDDVTCGGAVSLPSCHWRVRCPKAVHWRKLGGLLRSCRTMRQLRYSCDLRSCRAPPV